MTNNNKTIPKKELDELNDIMAIISSNIKPISLLEISAIIGLSKQVMHKRLSKLSSAKFVHIEYGRWRSFLYTATSKGHSKDFSGDKIKRKEVKPDSLQNIELYIAFADITTNRSGNYQ